MENSFDQKLDLRMSIARTFAVLRFSRLALSRAFAMLTLVDNHGARVACAVLDEPSTQGIGSDHDASAVRESRAACNTVFGWTARAPSTAAGAPPSRSRSMRLAGAYSQTREPARTLRGLL